MKQIFLILALLTISGMTNTICAADKKFFPVSKKGLCGLIDNKGKIVIIV